MSGGGENEGRALSLYGVNAVLNKHLVECAQQGAETVGALKALNEGHALILRRMDDAQSNVWKAAATLATIIVTAIVAMLFQTLQVKADLATKDEVVARTASRYTAQDAARDRAAQDAVNQAILGELKALRTRRR